MKYLCLLFFLIATSGIAQNNSNDSQVSNEFIHDFYKQLNIKLEVSNEKESYKISFLEQTPILSPNIGLRYSLGFNYRFASFRLGIRPTESEESKIDKGESDTFSMRVNLIFDKWSYSLGYNYVKGYYVKNTNDFTMNTSSVSNQIQFPNMKTSTLSGTTAYKFNPNYSVKSTESQTKIQVKSAGSLITSIDYWLYKVSDMRDYIDEYGNLIERDTYSQYQGLNTIINAGYYYTFVYQKNWYANVYATPGVGIDIYQIKATTPNEKYSNNYNDFIFSIQSGAAIGYNSKRYYFGADFHHRYTNENLKKNQFKLSTSTNSFHVFIGYRFKPPKTVSKTIDVIEQKIPVLQKDS